MRRKGVIRKGNSCLVIALNSSSSNYFLTGDNLMTKQNTAQPKDNFTKDKKILRDNLGLAKDISEVFE